MARPLVSMRTSALVARAFARLGLDGRAGPAIEDDDEERKLEPRGRLQLGGNAKEPCTVREADRASIGTDEQRGDGRGHSEAQGSEPARDQELSGLHGLPPVQNREQERAAIRGS